MAAVSITGSGHNSEITLKKYTTAATRSSATLGDYAFAGKAHATGADQHRI